jgi:hypothetical protein
MSLTRFYNKTNIEGGRLRGVRDLLSQSFHWAISKAKYELFYPSEKFSIEGTDELEEIIKKRGEPHSFTARFRTQHGSVLAIDTTKSSCVEIEASPTRDCPSKVLEKVGSVLGLTLIDSVPVDEELTSAFIVHSFDPHGRQCATEVGRFLELIGVRVHSGRSFAPMSVAEKVEDRLKKYAVVFVIVTPHEDYTWLNQEMGAAKIIGKPLFVLRQDDVDFKAGLLGDMEYIPFPSNHISETFIPILEGLNEISDFPRHRKV